MHNNIIFLTNQNKKFKYIYIYVFFLASLSMMPNGKYIYCWSEYKWPPVWYDYVEALATQVLRHFYYYYDYSMSWDQLCFGWGVLLN